jgi:hypothetical protein
MKLSRFFISVQHMFWVCRVPFASYLPFLGSIIGGLSIRPLGCVLDQKRRRYFIVGPGIPISVQYIFLVKRARFKVILVCLIRDYGGMSTSSARGSV